jgi:ribosome biogenesis GTPase
MKFTGIIMKGYSGFYYVLDEQQQVWECSLRGKFRLKKQAFLPGDKVSCIKINDLAQKGVIEEVLPRRSQLDRPLVANVDQVVIVMALAHPAPDFHLLDRILIMAGKQQVNPVVCLNKADLVEPYQASCWQKIYEKTGYPVLLTSAVENWGIDQLKELMKNQITVFAGPSGVGKSSLLNLLQTGLTLVTGEISSKINRGKHTTRHAQLMAFSAGGLLVDTPGFSRLALPQELKREELLSYYPDFFEFAHLCRFKTCLHREEPECHVREAVEKGLLDTGRYRRYLEIMAEVVVKERRY